MYISWYITLYVYPAKSYMLHQQQSPLNLVDWNISFQKTFFPCWFWFQSNTGIPSSQGICRDMRNQEMLNSDKSQRITSFIYTSHPPSHKTNLVGGWAYPSEKYEFVNWDDDIPNWMEKQKSYSKPSTSTYTYTYIYIIYIYIFIYLYIVLL